MLLSYEECKKQYGSQYQIDKAVESGMLFQLEKGIYSTKKRESDIAVISMKYPSVIFTMNSAFYFYGLTDDIPDLYYVVTKRGARKITDSRVVQKFENSEEALILGAEETDYEGTKILMYNRERMLLELIRHKNQLPFDYYKEILNNYRNIVHELNVQNITDYAEKLPKNKMIMETLRLEVF